MSNLINIRFLVVLFIDFIIGGVSINFSSYIRLGSIYSVSSYETLIAAFIVPSIFLFFKIYKTSWRYFSLLDMWSLIRICMVANIFIFICIFILNRLDMTPRLVIVLNFFTLAILACATRIIYRSVFEKFFLDANSKNKEVIPVLLVGSEENADAFIRGTERNNSLYKALGIISQSNIIEKNYLIRGTPILGNINSINDVVNKLLKKNILPQRLVLVSDNIKAEEMSELMQLSDKHGMKLGRAPSPSEVLDRNSNNSLIREVSLEDLLGRRQNRLDTSLTSRLIKNNVILITGAGGSIGKSLSKKISTFNPSKLIMIDVSENSIYKLKSNFESTNSKVKNIFLCSNIRNKFEMEKVFIKYKPDVVFHAGALKHVTICEENITEAIRTNVLATSMLSNLAEKYSCKCFVLISTDKAVEPTSVMGFTKKLAEIIVKSKDNLHERSPRFVVVRFGNVLGSTGSVVPLFRKQLSEGGPLTVTDKNATRFFMTIDEAVDLVIHASAESTLKPETTKGCVNVLNMGASIKIDDLAKQIIRLSGMTPEKDIKIRYTGLKKGEKLYEKLYADNERKINEGKEGYFLVNSDSFERLNINKLIVNLSILCDKEDIDVHKKLFNILDSK